MEELIPISLFMAIAAVAILRPLTTRAGRLLEAMARERTQTLKAGEDPDSIRLRALMEHVNRRLDLVEERLDFTERLISSTRPAYPAGGLRAEPFRSGREDLLSG